MLLCFYCFMRKSQLTRPPIRRIHLHPRTDYRLHALSQWINTNQTRAILDLGGKPQAVLVTYDEYNELEKLRTTHLKGQLLARLQSIKQRQLGY